MRRRILRRKSERSGRVEAPIVTTKGVSVGLLIIPKAASTSLRHALLVAGGHRDPDAPDEGKLRVFRNRGLKWASSAPFVVATVRHPLSRLVSCWRHRIGIEITRCLRGLGFDRDMSFPEFVQHLAKVGPDVEGHTTRQSRYLRVGYDLLCRVESLETDWQRVREIEPKLPPLGHMKNTGGSSGWAQYYDQPTEQLARDIYADDFRWYPD